MLTACSLSAQVIIGGATGSAGNNSSVLLDFPLPQNNNNESRGIILPYVTTLPSASSSAGTILLDASTASEAKVVYSNGTNWIDLSSGNTYNISNELGIQPTSITEDSNGKVIIGADTTSSDGVLVLEATDKAMVLPQVESTDDIISPAPGMMVYIKKQDAKRLAVFNGNKWTYWKAQ